MRKLCTRSTSGWGQKKKEGIKSNPPNLKSQKKKGRDGRDLLLHCLGGGAGIYSPLPPPPPFRLGPNTWRNILELAPCAVKLLCQLHHGTLAGTCKTALPRLVGKKQLAHPPPSISPSSFLLPSFFREKVPPSCKTANLYQDWRRKEEEGSGGVEGRDKGDQGKWLTSSHLPSHLIS